MLEQSPHLVIDGTFKTAPQLFTQSVLVDYELALRSAVLKVWPGTSLRSCWFHYKQALFRHLQAEGLAADYMVSDSPIKTCHHPMCHALRSRRRHRASLERAQADPSPRDDILRSILRDKLDRNSLLASPLRQRVLEPSRLLSDASTTLFEYSRGMEQRLQLRNNPRIPPRCGIPNPQLDFFPAN